MAVVGFLRIWQWGGYELTPGHQLPAQMNSPVIEQAIYAWFQMAAKTGLKSWHNWKVCVSLVENMVDLSVYRRFSARDQSPFPIDHPIRIDS
jgi:hypothetical protein